jgi:hypothetical protein
MVNSCPDVGGSIQHGRQSKQKTAMAGGFQGDGVNQLRAMLPTAVCSGKLNRKLC